MHAGLFNLHGHMKTRTPILYSKLSTVQPILCVYVWTWTHEDKDSYPIYSYLLSSQDYVFMYGHGHMKTRTPILYIAIYCPASQDYVFMYYNGSDFLILLLLCQNTILFVCPKNPQD